MDRGFSVQTSHCSGISQLQSLGSWVRNKASRQGVLQVGEDSSPQGKKDSLLPV